MLFGCAFLFSSLSDISKISVFISFAFVVVGIALAAFALSLKKRTVYMFFAALFLQIGLLLFLSALHIIPIELSKAWPLFSVFSGLSLIPAGWRHYGRFRAKYTVPAAAFILLGAGLLVFSLDFVSFSLSQFLIRWWPLLLVPAGLILILLALGSKHAGEIKQ